MQFNTSAEAKADGNFSRRHRTSEANEQARAEYRAKRGKAARQERARERAEHGSSLSKMERLGRKNSIHDRLDYECDTWSGKKAS